MQVISTSRKAVTRDLFRQCLSLIPSIPFLSFSPLSFPFLRSFSRRYVALQIQLGRALCSGRERQL